MKATEMRRHTRPYFRCSVQLCLVAAIFCLSSVTCLRRTMGSSSETVSSVSDDGRIPDSDEEDEEDDDDDNDNDEHPRWLAHRNMCEKTRVDLTDLSAKPNEDFDLGVDDPGLAAKQVMERIGSSVEKRMAKMFEKAKSPECRALIGEHVGHFINAIGLEASLPFADVEFQNECTDTKYDLNDLPKGMHFGHIQNRVYQPPRNESEYIDDPNNLILCYGILTHDDPASTIRIVNSLYQDGYIFIVHVDAKESSDKTQNTLLEFASTRDYVHILAHPYRVRVNWGGFSMVNATLQVLKYAFAVDQVSSDQKPLEFHKFVHIASTSYPIASNMKIRHKIASYPLDANLLNVIMKPTVPHPHSWHYFVECDDAVHRIYRLEPMGQQGDKGVDLYTSSQWFILSNEFSKYLAEARPGSFVRQFLDYVEHVVVADEAFFGTVLRNTQFCHHHHNHNFLQLYFDRWENEVEEGVRDVRKCMMPDPDHCGRSPTTMTMDYIDTLELSEDLFARKFTDSVDANIKDVIDFRRTREEKELKKLNGSEVLMHESMPQFKTDFDGHGVLIVAKETLGDDTPLCLGLGNTKNKVRLVPCFHDWVPSTLAPNWESGAVIEEETLLHNRWELGPCSSDGLIEKLATGAMNMTPGVYSNVGPRCMLKQVDGVRKGRCLDSESEMTIHGGATQVYPCIRKWNQFVSFGNGTYAPKGSMHFTVPRYLIKQLEDKHEEHTTYQCFGVKCRGDDKDGCVDDDEDQDEDNKENGESLALDAIGDGDRAPLSEWNGEQVVTTRCSNVGGVLDFVFVPYIVEDEEEETRQHEAEGTEDKEL